MNALHRPKRPWTRGLWSLIVCVLFGYATLHEVERLRFWEQLRILTWDVEGYHHYLPAAIIHHDLRDLSYVQELDSAVLHPTDPGQRRFGITRLPATGHDLIKYPCGTALFQLPLFLVAHAYCHLPGAAYPADGYSVPYQLAIGVSTALFVTLGLFLLRRLLLRHSDDRAAALALIAIGFGTNLFFYATAQPGMSHGYLFFLFALVLERTDQWHRTPKRGIAAVIGLALGLTVITRPVDGLVLLVPLCWNAWPGPALAAKKALVRAHPGHLLVLAACGLAAVLPQLAYWKATTGHFVFFSYVNEGFNFTDPHVLDGLFSYRKGWFVYSPLVALGAIGLVGMLVDRGLRPLALPVLAYFIPAVYVIFCWHDWAYGGSFGCRALVPALALLALPIATLSERILALPKAAGLLYATVILAGVHLNLFQQGQYLATIIRWDGMTKARYWEVFGVESWDRLTPFEP